MPKQSESTAKSRRRRRVTLVVTQADYTELEGIAAQLNKTISETAMVLLTTTLSKLAKADNQEVTEVCAAKVSEGSSPNNLR